MPTYTNVEKTPVSRELLNAVIQDAQNRVFMNGENKIYQEEDLNVWENAMAKSNTTWQTLN